MKKDMKNFIWNIIGSTFFGFSSLFFMIIITRINGLSSAGIFTYCFANACIFWTIAAYSGRTFQVTETDKKLTDTDYFYNRITTGIFAIVAVIIFCLITKASAEKLFLSLILTSYRSVEALIDSMHAVVQKNGELYKAGISLLARTLVLVTVLIVVDLITHNIIISSICLVLVNILFMLMLDYKNIKNKFSKSNFSKDINHKLLRLGFSTFLYSFLSIYVTSATKYAINSFSTDDIQAVYGIIIMPASFLSMVSTYLIQPFLNKITDYLLDDNMKSIVKLITKLSLAIIVIGILAIIVCYLIGIPILEFVYSTKLVEQKINLIIILVGSIFYSLVVLFSSVFIAMRKTNEQLVLLIITAISAFITSNIFVKASGMDGAAFSYLLVMFIEFFLHFSVLAFVIKKNSVKSR